MRRDITQIAIGGDSECIYIFALCDDATLWELDYANDRWTQIVDIPQPKWKP